MQLQALCSEKKVNYEIAGINTDAGEIDAREARQNYENLNIIHMREQLMPLDTVVITRVERTPAAIPASFSVARLPRR